MTEFLLACELHGHEGPVRAACAVGEHLVVTGGQDNAAVRWMLAADETGGVAGTPLGAAPGHERWVVAAAALPAGVLGDCPGGGFVTGSLDNLVRVFDAEGTQVRMLIGHSGGVISLGWTAGGQLISGSWDGTARVWDLESGSCVQTLPGHENGVCVLGLPNGDIVTGSTGVQVDQRIQGYQLRLWRDGAQVRAMTGHDGGVRCLALAPEGFASSANDGTVRLHSLAGDELRVMHAPYTAENKPPFLLGLAALPTGELVSAGEDGMLRVFRDGALAQTVEHPRGLWAVAALPNGDLLTACQDHVARVFTRDPERAAPAEAQAAFRAAVDEARAASAQGPSADEVSRLDDYDQRAQIPGSKDGDVRMFRREGKAWACSWSAASATWVDIGEVVGRTGEEGTIDGVRYDRVLPITIEDPRAPGANRDLKIGVNQTDNPFLAAQKFLDDNNLPQEHLQQIADYIIQHTGQAAPTLGDNAPAAAPQAPPRGQTTFLKFEGIKQLPQCHAKLLQLGGELGGDALTAADTAALTAAVGVLTDEAHYHSSRLPASLPALLAKLLSWPAEAVFAANDFCRIALGHPDAAQQLGGRHGALVVERLCQHLGAGADAPAPVALTAARALANMFGGAPSRAAVVAAAPAVLAALVPLTAHAHKGVRLAVATVALNMAVAAPLAAPDALQPWAELVSRVLQRNVAETAPAARALAAVVTLVANQPAARPVLEAAGIPGAAASWVGAEEPAGSAAGDVSRVW